MSTIMSPIKLSPIELPETRALIIQYLTKKHLVNCMATCKHWSILFASEIWRQVHLGLGCRIIPLKALHRYSQDIRYLEINGAVNTWVDFPAFTYLESFSVFMRFPSKKIFRPINGLMENTLSSCRYISTITLGNVDVNWKIISENKNIKHISLNFCGTDRRSSAYDFWDVCSTQLESLSLELVELPKLLLRVASEEEDIFFEKIKSLTIINMIYPEEFVILELARRCINLDSFHYQTVLESSCPKLFASLIHSESWPALRHLYYNGPILEKEQLDLTVRGLGVCRRWHVPCAKFDNTSFNSFILHLSSVLTWMDFETSNFITSKMSQEIFTTCSQLEFFKGTTIDAVDIIQGEPWVCSNLKELSILITSNKKALESLALPKIHQLNRSKIKAMGMHSADATKDTNSTSSTATTITNATTAITTTTTTGDLPTRFQIQMSRVFEQLSIMTSIKKISIGHPVYIENVKTKRYIYIPDNSPVEGLHLKLGYGLEKLGNWDKLEEFNFRGVDQDMELKDAEWIMNHWTRLTRMAGRFSRDTKSYHSIYAYVSQRVHANYVSHHGY